MNGYTEILGGRDDGKRQGTHAHRGAGGRLYVEVGIGQADSVLRIMRAQGFGDIQIVKDLHDIPRVVFGTLCTEI